MCVAGAHFRSPLCVPLRSSLTYMYSNYLNKEIVLSSCLLLGEIRGLVLQEVQGAFWIRVRTEMRSYQWDRLDFIRVGGGGMIVE